MPFFSLRLRRLSRRDRLVTLAYIELNNLEIFYVCDVAIFISINALEDIGGNFWRANDAQKLVCSVYESVELLEIHYSLRPFAHLSRLMISLKTQLSTMSFEKEVPKFNERNSPAAINIKPEDVFHDVINLVLTFFFKDLDDDFFNSLDLELSFVLEIRFTDNFKLAPK